MRGYVVVMPRPRVLLTNDDGIRADGIASLWRALREWADVTVVAPETVQSATGHGVTLSGPLLTQELHLDSGLRGLAVDGRPADCVKLALSTICPDVDLVVSGMNEGANVGIDVFYSGTVAAAVEGAFLGKPAVAVSLHLSDAVEDAHDWAASVAMRAVRPMWDNGAIKPGEVVNVNVPALADGEEPAGVEVAPQCLAGWADEFDRRLDPRGRAYYWNSGKFTLDRGGLEGTDVAGLRAKKVVVTPLHFDLTARDRLGRLDEALR